MSHTAGPWKLSIHGDDPSVTVTPDEHGYAPRIAYVDECYAHFEGQNLRGEAMKTANRDMREANARLLAAAPDMLEALMDIVVLASADGSVAKLARAAITKATARQA